jgi:hypothetical protein
MTKALEEAPARKRRERFSKGYIYMRRSCYLLFASALVFAGVAFSVFEIIKPEGLSPFVLFTALTMVSAGGAWLLDELVLLTHRG